MLYKSGDVDDIGVLFIAMLEAVGIEAGYIPLADDFIVLIDVKQAESKVGSMLDGTDRAIIIDESVWIPVSMSTLKEGFVNSWYNAVTEIMDAYENDEDVSFYTVQDGWTFYPAVSFSSGSGSTERPLETLLTAAVEIDMSRYITTEFGPQIAALQYQIKEKGMTVDLLNKLGLLYVRAGIYSSAIPVYEKAAGMGSVAAMNNLGNIAVVQSRYADAKMWYERALAVEPNNSTALKGLNRALGQLEE
jgi:tetratricopeptide (TPR) repeat protein